MNDSLLLNKIDTLNSHIGNIKQEFIQNGSHRLFKDSVFDSKLDSLGRQLSSISHTVETADAHKTILIVVSIVGPLLVGFVLFILNRNKEHHSKKSELCGEIYGKIIELKNVVADITQNQIYTSAYAVIISIQSDEEYEAYGPPDRDEIPKEEYYKRYLAYNKTVVKDQTLRRKIVSDFAKSVGQYRLYLPQRRRKEFDELLKSVQEMSAINYDFINFKSVNQVEKEISRIRNNFRNDLRDNYSSKIDKLQNFIDENSGVVMFDND